MSVSSFPPAFVNAYKGDEILNFSAVMIGIISCFAVLRFIARFVSKTKFGADDYLAIPALLSIYALCGILIATVKVGGVGRHAAVILETDPETLVMFIKLNIPYAIAYILATTFPKLSILCLYLRIFIAKWSRYACYALITILSTTMIANVIAGITQCIPLSNDWAPSPGGHCFNQNAWFEWGSFPNILTDLCMLVLPLPILFQLQMSWKDKLGTTLTFMAGGIGLVTSILRFVAFFDNDTHGSSSDPTWTGVTLTFYSVAEASVYFVACCLPTYRSLYLTIRRKNTTSAKGSTRGYFAQWRRTESSSQEAPGTHLSTMRKPASGFRSLESDRNSLIESINTTTAKDSLAHI